VRRCCNKDHAFSSSEKKLEVNNIKDALIAEESYQLAKTSNTNTKSVFISSATTYYNYSSCEHFA
jgi:hypothetical protein